MKYVLLLVGLWFAAMTGAAAHASYILAQAKPNVVCVAQVKGTLDPPEPGYDAAKLVMELSRHDLPGAESLQAIVISKKSDRPLITEAAATGCSYFVSVWRHASLNRVSGVSGPDPTSNSRATVAPVQDQDLVQFEMRRVASGKVIRRGSGRVPTIFRLNGEHTLVVPYPALAKQIAERLAP